LYKEILEVPIVVEATMEEQVLKNCEVIKGFPMRIEDLQLRSTSGMPPEERERREKMALISIANIKKVEEECTKIYEESV